MVAVVVIRTQGSMHENATIGVVLIRSVLQQLSDIPVQAFESDTTIYNRSIERTIVDA
jgi:hypothetical protein